MVYIHKNNIINTRQERAYFGSLHFFILLYQYCAITKAQHKQFTAFLMLTQEEKSAGHPSGRSASSSGGSSKCHLTPTSIYEICTTVCWEKCVFRVYWLPYLLFCALPLLSLCFLWKDSPAGCPQYNSSWLPPLSYFPKSSTRPWQHKVLVQHSSTERKVNMEWLHTDSGFEACRSLIKINLYCSSAGLCSAVQAYKISTKMCSLCKR